MQVCSEKISLPVQAGVVHMVDVVPPIVGRCLVAAGASELGDEELPATRPGMCSKIDADEWQKLLMRMMACGTVVVFPESVLPRWSGQVVVSGLLAVPEPGGVQRLIIDRRWPSAVETDLLTALGL